MCKLNKFPITFLILIIIFADPLFAKENSAAVFLYHRFGENKYPSTNTKMSQFKKHIDELTNNNYNVISINEIVDAFVNKKDLPEKTVGITIDDAFLSIYKKRGHYLKKKNYHLQSLLLLGQLDLSQKII